MNFFSKSTKILFHAIIFTLLHLNCSSDNSNVKIISSEVLTGCVSGDCVNGYGKYIYYDGIEYLGYWKDGEREGYGRLLITNTEIGGNNDFQKVEGKLSKYNNAKIEQSKSKNRNNKSIEEGYEQNNRLSNLDLTIGMMLGFVDVVESVDYMKEQHKIYKRNKKKKNKIIFCEIQYEGEWKNNKRHGLGIMKNSDCSKIKGYWENDILIKKSK